MISWKGATMNFAAPMWLWVAFDAFVLVMLALDLGVFHRTSHAELLDCRT
jgi:hypothetical protein